MGPSLREAAEAEQSSDDEEHFRAKEAARLSRDRARLAPLILGARHPSSAIIPHTFFLLSTSVPMSCPARAAALGAGLAHDCMARSFISTKRMASVPGEACMCK